MITLIFKYLFDLNLYDIIVFYISKQDVSIADIFYFSKHGVTIADILIVVGFIGGIIIWRSKSR